MHCGLIAPAALCFALVAAAAFAAESPGRDEYLYARKLFEERYYDLAADQLERCLRDYPGLEEADEAQYLLGEAYLRNGDPDRARAAFLRTAIVYPESPRAPEALFKVGESLETAGRRREAAQAYERVQGFYSGSGLAARALGRSATLYGAVGDSVRADEIAGALIEKYPDSPYASISRLERAGRLAARGDLRTALQYLNWVATRAGTDSLSAEAYVRIGRVERQRFDLSSAREAYELCINQFPALWAASVARIELAGLENLRGSSDEAIAVAAPLLASSQPEWRARALIVSGDAEYLRNNYEQALSYYDSVGTGFPEGMLKGAWTAELLGRRKSAFDRYSKLAGGTDEIAISARLRAALLAFDLGQAERAAGLWIRLLEDVSYSDTSGRALLELARARAEAKLEGVGAAADTLLATNAGSPYTDDAIFLAARAAFKRGDYAAAVERFEELIRRCPASALRDSAAAGIEFIRNFHLREGTKLIERMAELSSLPQNRTNPVRWALDWGDFYLDEFKDPVKAVDQYDRVLDDILATTEDRLYALFRSGLSYQLLAEAARREKDSFSWPMYSDSAHSRVRQLQRLDPQGPQTLRLATRLIEFDARLARSGDAAPAVIAKRCDDLISRFGVDSLPAMTITIYLEALSESGRVDAKNIPALIATAEGGITRADSDHLRARLKRWEVTALMSTGQEQAAVDTARAAIVAFPQTVDAAELTLQLAAYQPLPARTRYDYLQRYRQLYPYRVDAEQVGLLEADLLDLLDRPIDALAARQQADAAAGWGRPKIDLLLLPPPNIRLERASAFRRAGRFAQAAEELSIVLNSQPAGELAAPALLELALVEEGRQNPQGALLLLDSLSIRYPGSPSSQRGDLEKPGLLMALSRFQAAEAAWAVIAGRTSDPDHLFECSVQQIVCKYRQDKLEEARKAALDLYKRFKEHNDLDQTKALFYLEKGRSLDRAKRYVEAREQFATVRDKYPLTISADDAAYALALSFASEGRRDEAAKLLERFVADYPESPLALEGWLSLGLAQYQLEKYSEAVTSLKRVWDARGAERLWQAAFEALATVYRNLRFFDAAIRLSRDYLDRFPDAPDALDRRMDIAQFYLELKEWDEAVRQYRPLLPLADAEREAEIQYYIGEAFLGKGDYRSAILEFLKVKVLGRKTKLDWGVTAIYQAGFCYEKLGDYEGAARMYHKIIEETGESSNYGRAAQQKLDSIPKPQP